MKVYLPKHKDGIFIGLDLATKSGWAIIKSNGKGLDLIDYGSIAMPSGISEIGKLTHLGSTLENILDGYFTQYNRTNIKGSEHLDVTIIIEDCFLGKCNPKTFKTLSRMEGYIIKLVESRYSPDVRLVYPSFCRKLMGLNGNCKKEVVIDFINKSLKKDKLFKMAHNNITDAILLALVGEKQGV